MEVTSNDETPAAGGTQQRTGSHSDAQPSDPSVRNPGRPFKARPTTTSADREHSRSRSRLESDRDEVQRALTVLLAPGQVTELRALQAQTLDDRRRRTLTGYFNNPVDLVDALFAENVEADGIYIVPNPVNPGLLARAANRIKPAAMGSSTGDDHIVSRRWLLIDFDPVRPSGISSTEAEHEAALNRARDVRAALRELGWPEPVLADSGNGAHLLYRIDLPTDEEGLVKRVLEALAFRFDDEDVKVDTSTHNPARIWKLYGTPACKGDHLPERPHRLARLINVPEPLTVVDGEWLEALADSVPDPPTAPNGEARGTQSTPGSSGTAGFDLGRWIAGHGLPVDGPYAWRGGRLWIFPVCPWNPEHTNRSAYLVQFENGAISAGCHHHSCADHNWHALRDLVEPGWSEHFTSSTEDFPKQEPVGETPGSPTPPDREWPKPLHDAAYHGLAGEIVRVLEPETEADPAALLVTLLAAVGNMVGPGPHWQVGTRAHSLRISPVLVGRTSKGRKGTALAAIRPLLEAASPQWHAECLASGLSSGEGLIWAVRDAIVKMEPVREGGKRTGRIIGYEEVMIDAGVSDKRLLVIEEEFAAVLKVMGRDANILSDVLRQAWDGETLRTLAKNAPAIATGAHLTVLGHITEHELTRYLNDTEAGNGFANRFLWVCVQRARLLPDGGHVDPAVLNRLGLELADVITAAQNIGLIERDADANTLWHRLYGPLSDDQPGLLGAITSRAEAQVMRIAAIYAVLDKSRHVRPAHLRAAVALWDYLEASVRHIFGDAMGDPVADTILSALRRDGELTRTQIRDLFKRNQPAGRIETALTGLETSGRATRFTRKTGGRPEEIWQLIDPDFGRHGRFGRAGTASEHGYLHLILAEDEERSDSDTPNDGNDENDGSADDERAGYEAPAEHSFEADYGSLFSVDESEGDPDSNSPVCRTCGESLWPASGIDPGLCDECAGTDAA